MYKCIEEKITEFSNKNKKQKYLEYTEINESGMYEGKVTPIKIKHILSKWNYVWLLYQALEDIDNTMGYPSLFETIYRMALGRDADSLCTGTVKIRSTKEMIYSGFIVNYTQDSPYLDGFIEEFSDRIRNCEFTSLAITYSYGAQFSHRNMLLIYKKNDKIHVYLYEPHGRDYFRSTEEIEKMYSDIDNFVRIIVDKYNHKRKKEKMEMVKEERISQSCSHRVVNALVKLFYKDDDKEAVFYTKLQQQGIQSKIDEQRLGAGYCVMYSYFWLYILLHCFKYNKDISTIYELFTTVEQSFHRFPSLMLSNAINAFAIEVYNVYLTNIFLNSKEDGNKLLEIIDKAFKQRLYNRKLIIGSEITKIKRPLVVKEVSGKYLQKMFKEPKKFYDPSDFGIGLEQA